MSIRTVRDVYVVDAVRTPIGKFGGALAGVRPDDLAAHVVRALVDRTPDLDPARIDDVVFGDANGAGEDNRDVARMAVLLAGLPVSVPGVTVNRLCGSGLEAVIQAARAIAVGDASVAIAGGVESMSRAPWVVQKPERAFPAGHQQMWSTTLGWRMTNPRMPEEWTCSLGEGAELVADKHGITREAQDAFALESHRKAAAAWAAGLYDDEVVPYTGVDLVRDECIREGSTPEALARPPAASRSPGSAPPPSPESSPSSSVWARWTRCSGRSPRPAAGSPTSPPSNSTRLSPHRRWAVLRPGRSWTRPWSTRAAAPSRSVTRSVPRAPGWPARSRTSWRRRAPVPAWRPCVSASGRASRSSWSADPHPPPYPRAPGRRSFPVTVPGQLPNN